MSWLDTIFKMTPLGRYNAISPQLANGSLSELQSDSSGRLLVNTESPTTLWADGGMSTSTRAVKSSAGKLYQIFGRNVGASTVYLFVYDSATKPADGSSAHIFVPIAIEAGAVFSIALIRPRSFATGLTWVASSTDGTLTYASGATVQVSAEYE